MPIARPATAATTGFGQVESVARYCITALSSPSGGAAAKSRRSLPLVNTPPAPASRMTRTPSSAIASRMACVIALYIATVNAFFFSGRAMRMVSTAPVRSTWTWSVMRRRIVPEVVHRQ